MKRWYEISLNPLVPEVQAYRKNRLAIARVKTLIENRIDYLCNLVTDKDILDVGVVAHMASFKDDPNWLHKYLNQAAKSCLGVDILENEVEKLRQDGFNVICTDIIKNPLKQKFDVIICGEVLEHVSEPGSLLASLTKMLNTGGRIIITVPNPWYIGFMMKNIVESPSLQDNVDHVCWFDPCTICELGERNHLILDSFRGVRHTEHNEQFRLLKNLFLGLTSLYIRLGIKPELFAKTMIYEFILDEKPF